MFPLLLYVLLVLHLSSGVPLESPSDDLSQYFSRIVGGEEASTALAPHMAALVINEFIRMLFCGGSIISSRHVLTAAHCIDVFVISGDLPSSYHVVVGTNDWFHKGIEARVTEFHIHPQWDPKFIKNDVGILVLNEDLKLNKKVGVISLNYGRVGGDEDCYVTGWGRLATGGITPFKLQILFVKTLFAEECARNLLEAPVWGGSPLTFNEEVEICTFHSTGHGMCHGDSGSALVQTNSNQQIGIASWGHPCGRGLPDVFVRLSSFEDFIKRILKK